MKSILSRPIINWLLIATIVIFSLIFVYDRGQDQNWDLLNYHYYSGYSLLHGSFTRDISPIGLQSFLPPAPNVLSYTFISNFSFPTSAWAITLLQLLSLPILISIAKKIIPDFGNEKFNAPEFLALTICLLSPLWWSELGTSFYSATTTPIILLGVYLGLQKYADNRNSNNLIFPGILLGLASGLKLTNAIFSIGFIAALLAVKIRNGDKHSFRRIIFALLGMAIGFLLTSWWNIYLMHKWSSPLFPFYNEFFQSPYYDPVNFRDMRWHFSSLKDFIYYVISTVTGTAKTSEILFADARIIITLSLLPFVFVFGKLRHTLDDNRLFLLVFFFVSYFLWAFLFAYQRYLIPIELVFGLVIWILLSQLIKNNVYIVLLLSAILVFSAIHIEVPDWGHSDATQNQDNAFNLELPNNLVETPAIYLVEGKPVGYIFPFLHPDSRFYGLGFSAQVDAMIRTSVINNNLLPLRVLTLQTNSHSIWSIIEPYGYTPQKNSISCSHFSSNFDKYIICEVQDKVNIKHNLDSSIVINFLEDFSLLPNTILGFTGLSHYDSGGRWSDNDEITLHTANCLPIGKLKISVSGHAFGPNIENPVYVSAGSNKKPMIFKGIDSEQRVIIDNKNQCQRTIIFEIPRKTSPWELGLSGDRRKLGIALLNMHIEASQ